MIGQSASSMDSRTLAYIDHNTITLLSSKLTVTTTKPCVHYLMHWAVEAAEQGSFYSSDGGMV